MTLCFARVSSNLTGVANVKMKVTVLDKRWVLVAPFKV